MADPTLKEVLVAIADARADISRVDTKVDKEVLAAIADARADISRVEPKVDAHRAETAKAFTELDRELTKHATVHRELEKDITNLKRRPPRTAARPARRR